ncbi:MAG: hypothetical protein WD556_10580 [Actinomycetota bacterium]
MPPPRTSAPLRRSAPEHVPDVVVRRDGAVAALATWAVVIIVAWLWGRWLQAGGTRLFLNAPPLTAHTDPRFPPLTLVPVLVGAVAVGVAPVWAVRLRWRTLVAVAFAGSALFAVALALVDGTDGFTGPVQLSSEYLVDAQGIGSVTGFLVTFVERIGGFATHVRSHPPGMVLLVHALGAVGLTGPWPVAALELLGFAAAAPAVLVAVRETAGEHAARRAVPFVTLAPAAVFATTGDGFFAGLGAWAVACLVLAMRPATDSHDRRRATTSAVAGGVLFGATLFCSYGLVLLGTIPLAVARSRRRVRPILIAAAGIVAVALVFLLAGFWWVEGLFASSIQYRESIARLRPYTYASFASLAAFAIALGPALAVGLARLRQRGVWVLTGAALVAVGFAALSGMSKLETERIWLPFAVWVLAAGSALWPAGELRVGIPSVRRWLALQVGAAIVLQVTVAPLW